MLETQYRVWPDGTVQAVEDGEPYSWMSDDFAVVWACDENEANHAVLAGTVKVRNRLHVLEALLDAQAAKIADLERALVNLNGADLDA